MFQWVVQHLVWFAIRVAVTLVCIWTVHNVVHREGYYISYETLMIGAACLIIGVRMWMPSYKEKS